MTRILLAEDEPVLARNIKRALEKAGARVTHAATAAKTRAALAAASFDLVIADITLGDGDGIDVLSAEADVLQNTPVIVMTGQDSVQNRARAERIPVAAFLAKPFALARLRELMFALTRNSETEVARAGGSSIVMYSHDTIGLGHMRRNSAIARELVNRVPGVSVLMLVGCPVGMVFEAHPGIDYVKLPSLAKMGRGVFQPGSLRIDADKTRALRARIIEGVLSSIEPDLFLVDHEPAGVMDELRPILTELRKTSHVKTVLGLRDILDEPDRVRANWAAGGIDHLVAQAYDHVLIYGDDQFFPSADAYGLSELKPGAVTQCGLVTTVQAKRRRRPAGRAPHVVVSGGGGRDAYPLIEASIKAYFTLPQRRRPQMTVVTGPLMDDELKAEAFCLTSGSDIRVIEHVPHLPSLMQEASLLVTMTGYNSINEALALGCPVVTVPRLGPSGEQRLRAEALEKMGLARYLRREDLSPEALAKIMLEIPTFPKTSGLRLNGVSTAAETLATMIAASHDTEKERAHA